MVRFLFMEVESGAFRDRKPPKGSITIPDRPPNEDVAHFQDRATRALLRDTAGAPAVTWRENGMSHWLDRSLAETRFTREVLMARIGLFDREIARLEADRQQVFEDIKEFAPRPPIDVPEGPPTPEQVSYMIWSRHTG